MDIYHLSIPALVDNFYLDTDRQQIAAKMKQIYATYKNEIDTVSALTHVPVTLILSIISLFVIYNKFIIFDLVYSIYFL